MMDDKDLQALWSQQASPKLDLHKLKKRWHRMRLQQWFFLFFDLFAFIGVMLVVVVAHEKFNWLSSLIVFVVLLATAIFTSYTVWLRRHSITRITNDTQSHMQQLKKQLTNNITLAKLNIKVLVPMAVAMNLFVLSQAILGPTEKEKIIFNFLIINGLLILLYMPMWQWSKRRIKKSQQELQNLQNNDN